MFFNISFMSNRVEESPGLRYGEIEINDFRERFEVDLSFWTPEQYVQHWDKSIQRIVGQYETSCLITSLPSHPNWITWWPMYKIGDEVHIQNQWLFTSDMGGIATCQLQGEFDPDNPYKDIGPRETLSEEGDKISEWKTSLEALREYLARRESP